MPKCFLSIKLACHFTREPLPLHFHSLHFLCTPSNWRTAKAGYNSIPDFFASYLFLLGFRHGLCCPFVPMRTQLSMKTHPQMRVHCWPITTSNNIQIPICFMDRCLPICMLDRTKTHLMLTLSPSTKKTIKQVGILLLMRGKMRKSIVTASTKACCRECGAVGMQPTIWPTTVRLTLMSNPSTGTKKVLWRQ